jgi:hypothetical protein
MVKTNVYGSVGVMALKDPPLELLAQSRMLKSLRDILEDRLESRFNVFVQIGTSSTGGLELSIAENKLPLLLEDLIAVAADCVREFNEAAPALTLA